MRFAHHSLKARQFDPPGTLDGSLVFQDDARQRRQVGKISKFYAALSRGLNRGE